MAKNSIEFAPSNKKHVKLGLHFCCMTSYSSYSKTNLSEGKPTYR